MTYEGSIVDESGPGFTRIWALKWVRGSVESYIVSRTSLDIVKGRVRRAVESYGVKPEEVEAIVSLIVLDPLLNAPRELREERAKPLLEFIRELGGSG